MSRVLQFFLSVLVFLGVSRLRIVCTGLWSDPVWNLILICEEIRELSKELEIKEKSIADEGGSRRVLALVGV